MENFHSTKGLVIENHPNFGTRVVVSDVGNSTTKNKKFSTIVSSDANLSKGDALRKFFEMLDRDEVKSMQGAVLRCSKKDLYYFDEHDSFPKGIGVDPTLTNKSILYLRLKTAKYTDGVKQEGSTCYRSAGFDLSTFPAEADTPAAKAKWVKDNLGTILTKDSKRIVEYIPSNFEKVPFVNVPVGSKYPKGIEVTYVSTSKGIFKASVECPDGHHIVTMGLEDIPNNLYKPLYAWYVAKAIYDFGINTIDGRIGFNRDTGEYVFTLKSDPATNPEVTKPQDEGSEVIADPKDKRAQALVGRRVFASQSFTMNKKFLGILQSINPDSDKPFVVDGIEVYTIREAPEPKLECYDFREKEVRRSLFGKIFTNSANDCEEMVHSFKVVNGRWVLNGKITAYDFMVNYIWEDGSRCGVVTDVADL